MLQVKTHTSPAAHITCSTIGKLQVFCMYSQSAGNIGFTRDINSNVLAYCMYYLQYLQAICRQSLGKILQINHSIQISCRYFAYAVKLQAMYRLIAHITRNSKFTCKLLQKPVDCLLHQRASCRYFVYAIKLQAMDRWVPGSTRPFNEQNICNVYVYYRNKLEKLFKLRARVKELKIRITLEIFFKLNKDLLTCSNSSKLVKIRIKKKYN